MKKIISNFCMSSVFIGLGASGMAQGFLNLDFEGAKVNDLPFPGAGELIYFTNGVPGWDISPTAGDLVLMS